MVPKHVLAKAADPNTAPFNNAPVGTGPFKWVERVPGDHITLAANADFYGDGPYLERLIFKYVPDLTVLYTQFRTGDIDYIGLQGITADHYEEAKKLAGPRRRRCRSPSREHRLQSRPAACSRNARCARRSTTAWTSRASSRRSTTGCRRQTESFLPQQSWAFNPDLPKHEYNPEKAKKLLDAAGWKPGSDGVREKNGVRLEFANSTTAGNHVREQAQQLLQQNWQEIGVKMTINNLPPAVMWGDYWMKSKFETAMVGIDFMIGPDPDATRLLRQQVDRRQGRHRAEHHAVQQRRCRQLLQEGASHVRPAKRKAIYRRCRRSSATTCPILPIFQYTLVEGTKAGLEGFRPNINVQMNSGTATIGTGRAEARSGPADRGRAG